MTDINWKVESIEWNSSDGGVVTVHWRVSASDDINYTDSYGSIGFTPNSEDPNFIPIDSLTEENVILWLKANEQLQNIEQGLINQLEQMKSPSTQVGLPWIDNEGE